MSATSEPIDLGAILHCKVYDQYNDLIIRLKRGSLLGSYSVAKQTALLLRLVIGHTRWENVESLIQILRTVGRGLVSAQPVELAVGNIVRRVLFIVRQEYERLVKEMGKHNKLMSTAKSRIQRREQASYRVLFGVLQRPTTEHTAEFISKSSQTPLQSLSFGESC